MPTALSIDRYKKLKNIINHHHQGCHLYRISRTINQLADNKGPFWLWVVIYMTHPRAHRLGPPPLLCQHVTQRYASLVPHQPLCRCLVTPSEPCGLTYDLQHLEEAQFLITFDPAVFITTGTCWTHQRALLFT